LSLVEKEGLFPEATLSGGAFPFDYQEPTRGYIAFLFAILFVLLAIVLLLTVTSSNGTIVQPLETRKIPAELSLDASQKTMPSGVLTTNESKSLDS
jgi:hypothetical protein